MPGESRAKHWLFTLNNATDDEILNIADSGEALKEGIVYLIAGAEVGKEGTFHIQGFVSFKTKKGRAALKRVISPRVYSTPAKGTPRQNQVYCSKDTDFVEWGECPGGQGTRTDLAQVANKIKEGASFGEIAEEHPGTVLRYGSGVLRLINLVQPKRDGPPVLWCFWGPTGTGKTRRVWEFAKETKLYVHPGDRWFDGYDRQPAVLFDDFDGGWFKLTYLLKLIDRYIMQVPVKGGYTWWVPKTIYFTSNLHPKDWFPNAGNAHRAALMRRFNEFGTIQEVTHNSV